MLLWQMDVTASLFLASVRGAIMVGGQKIQVGLTQARKTAEVTVGADTYQITVEDGIALTAPRRTSRDINRHKASNYQPGQPAGCTTAPGLTR